MGYLSNVGYKQRGYYLRHVIVDCVDASEETVVERESSPNGSAGSTSTLVIQPTPYMQPAPIDTCQELHYFASMNGYSKPYAYISPDLERLGTLSCIVTAILCSP